MARRVRYLDEPVVGTVSGFGTTTHRNRLGYKLMKEQLEQWARQPPGLPFHVGHDVDNPPVGKIVRSEVRELPDGECGLWIEIEMYDEKVMRAMKKQGGPSVGLRSGPLEGAG